MPFTPRMHHFATSVSDLERTVKWYCGTLGFQEEFRYELPEQNIQAVFLELEDFRVELYEQAGADAPSAAERDFGRYLGVHGLKHVTFAVDDVEATRRELEERGVEFVTPVLDVPNSGGERFCFFADPDGVFLELYQPVPRHEHGRDD